MMLRNSWRNNNSIWKYGDDRRFLYDSLCRSTCKLGLALQGVILVYSHAFMFENKEIKRKIHLTYTIFIGMNTLNGSVWVGRTMWKGIQFMNSMRNYHFQIQSKYVIEFCEYLIWFCCILIAEFVSIGNSIVTFVLALHELDVFFIFHQKIPYWAVSQ